MTVHYQEAKKTFINLYGDDSYNDVFSSFDEAFLSAWDSFDYISSATTIEEFAEGMSECWQLQQQ